MPWTLFAILLITWVLGYRFHVGGGFIHILLAAAVIIVLRYVITGHRSSA